MLEKIANVKVFNDTFVDMLEGGQTKEASVSAQQYTRNKLRENSFAEKILTPIDIANDELDKSEDPELHVKWCDREPDQPPAATIPLGTTADGFQFKGTRYPVYFSRLVSPLFQKDVDKLRGYDYDIRQILLENATKDLATEVDTKFIDRVNSVMGLVNTANALNALGLPQYVTISGGITRSNLADAQKVIQKLKVPFGPLQPDGGASKGIMLMNNVTAGELLKFERSEVGGDDSQKMFNEGVPLPKILGIPVLYTIKRELVPDNTIYFFSSEEFFGKYFRLQPLTVFMETKAFFLQFFQYMNIGMSIGNVKGCCRVDFV
ncbi:MAG: hypothetical protein EBU46_09150 [Nitrosomonadaceae bacterium]|nr:hypothetical protein [Nitrosomonadaceae bacterium]